MDILYHVSMLTFVLNEIERKPPNSLTLTHMYNRIHVHGIDIQMECMWWKCTYKYMQMDDDANEILDGTVVVFKYRE